MRVGDHALVEDDHGQAGDQAQHGQRRQQSSQMNAAGADGDNFIVRREPAEGQHDRDQACDGDRVAQEHGAISVKARPTVTMLTPLLMTILVSWMRLPSRKTQVSTIRAMMKGMMHSRRM